MCVSSGEYYEYLNGGLAPCMYFLRLQQGGEAATARVMVIR
ncbi:MAG: hypothetical protein R6U39_01440 [Candidatus Aegiribacteria sp.]